MLIFPPLNKNAFRQSVANKYLPHFMRDIDKLHVKTL